jgi:hypothetical protein
VSQDGAVKCARRGRNGDYEGWRALKSSVSARNSETARCGDGGSAPLHSASASATPFPTIHRPRLAFSPDSHAHANTSTLPPL